MKSKSEKTMALMLRLLKALLVGQPEYAHITHATRAVSIYVDGEKVAEVPVNRENGNEK